MNTFKRLVTTKGASDPNEAATNEDLLDIG